MQQLFAYAYVCPDVLPTRFHNGVTGFCPVYDVIMHIGGT
jgi:hypothetical protein